MNIDTAEELCKNIGVVKKFNENKEVFGNIELEIETPGKTLFEIISDRGEFSCYVIKKRFLRNSRVPVGNITEKGRNISFDSLESAIDYLKNNIEIIEKG